MNLQDNTFENTKNSLAEFIESKKDFIQERLREYEYRREYIQKTYLIPFRNDHNVFLDMYDPSKHKYFGLRQNEFLNIVEFYQEVDNILTRRIVLLFTALKYLEEHQTYDCSIHIYAMLPPDYIADILQTPIQSFDFEILSNEIQRCIEESLGYDDTPIMIEGLRTATESFISATYES